MDHGVVNFNVVENGGNLAPVDVRMTVSSRLKKTLKLKAVIDNVISTRGTDGNNL